MENLTEMGKFRVSIQGSPNYYTNTLSMNYPVQFPDKKYSFVKSWVFLREQNEFQTIAFGIPSDVTRSNKI